MSAAVVSKQSQRVARSDPKFFPDKVDRYQPSIFRNLISYCFDGV